MQKVKIIGHKSGTTLGTRVYLDDNELKHVTSIGVGIECDSIPKFTFDVWGYPDIEMTTEDITINVKPKDLSDSIDIIMHEIKKKDALYNSILEKISNLIANETVKDGLGEEILNALIDFE